ncbi:MAG: T9SS type A sorting domain-containing protein, partial [Ignavibacteriaceae bacterium]|nr:T9SS type A sorting domain-containing protein [Ignavibacteriaceae bacterium]
NASGNYMWGRVPTSNPVNGSTPKTLTMQFVYNNTGSGINPSTNRTETPLPVELTSFNANAFGKDVKLNWSTATEVNSYKFVVEKGENNGWNAIGSVNAAGNSNSPKVYSFTDNNLQPGKYQYRLKMIDNDGSYEYSSSVEVDIEIPKEYVLMQNYPNPFNPVTNINYTIPVDSKVMLVIYSISGEKVAELVNETQSSGSYSIPFNASHLASGTYVYRLIANDFVQTKKMLLIK